jgi:hypothetical protein
MAKPGKTARRKLRLSEKMKRAQKRHPPAEHLPYSESWAPDPARSLEAKLFEFSREILSHEDFNREQKNFCGPLETIRDLDEGEIAGLFVEWFLRDYRLEGGGSVLEEFEGVNGAGLPAPERALLRRWIDFSQRRVLEVREKLSGDRTRLRDILTGEEWDVYDRSLAAQAVIWEIHYARLYPLPQAMGLFGTSFLLDPTDAPGLRAFLAALQAAGQGRTAAEFYRDFYPVILKEVLRLQNESARPPVILTPEGDPIEFGVIRFRLIDRKAALARLNVMPEIQPENPDADGRSVLRFVWLEPEEVSKSVIPPEAEGMTRHSFRLTPDGRGAIDSKRILGFLRVSRGVLELECLSRSRLERGRSLLSKSLRGAAEAEPGIRPPRPAGRKGGEEKEIPPEVIREIEGKISRRFSAEWPDQSIPALGGLTPRQAAADPVVRYKLEALLKGMETRNARMEAAGERSVMDAAGIRRQLGMAAGDEERKN